MSQIDPYKVLNIPRNASQEEIEAAYRRAVGRFGPDAGFNPMYAQLHANATTAYQMLMTQPASAQPAPEAEIPDSAQVTGHPYRIILRIQRDHSSSSDLFQFQSSASFPRNLISASARK